MLCCPVVKSGLLLAGLACLGYTGWEASSYYQSCQQKTPCCSMPQIEVIQDESDCCASDVTASTTPNCCSKNSRAATLVSSTNKTISDECCEDATPSTAATPVVTTIAPANVAAAEGWATLKGQVIFAGDVIPKAEESKVTSDQAHCLAKGALTDKVWDVNPSNKGLAGVVVFIAPDRGETLAVHPDQKAPPAPFVLDQPYCVFTPRIFAIRAGQEITAKNPDPVAHNVVIKGLKNDLNVQIPPGTEKSIKLDAETNAMSVACGSHPWMKGFGWCFDHPYFAVTDKDGKFEIKNIPAGNRKVIVWHETGYLPGYSKRDQKTVSLAAGSVTDLGTVKAMLK